MVMVMAMVTLPTGTSTPVRCTICLLLIAIPEPSSLCCRNAGGALLAFTLYMPHHALAYGTYSSLQGSCNKSGADFGPIEGSDKMPYHVLMPKDEVLCAVFVHLPPWVYLECAAVFVQ